MPVLIVDDSQTNLMVMRGMVERLGVDQIVTHADPAKALAEIEGLAPGLVLVDYMMPGIDGIEFIRRVRAIEALSQTPIIMVTTADLPQVRLAALDSGATDFVTKPIDPAEFMPRVRNLLAFGRAQAQLRSTAAWLAEEVRVATEKLAAREEEIIFRLARAAEFRDTDTGDHVSRIALLSRILARALGQDEAFCQTLYLAAPMHDVGKIGVPDSILLKDGPLTNDERARMQEHVRYGEEILSASTSDLIRLAAEIARTHHERWDGAGYPHRMAGEDIPLSGRIVAVADVFDALVSRRPYKEPWPLERARAYLIEQSGRHFDPACVTAFLSRWEEVVAVVQPGAAATAGGARAAA